MQGGPTPQPPQAPQVFGRGPSGQLLGPPGSAPNAVYEAYRHQRGELAEQLDRLENQRRDISEQLRQPTVGGADQKGLEARLATVDARIASTEKQLADAEAAVATAAAVPGAVIPRREPPRSGPPEEFFVLTGFFMLIVILPLTIAYARRIWRRGAATVASIPQELYDRFNRMDQAIDSVAIEVERIGEGQRFLTRMYSEQQKALGAGPAERIQAADREKERQR